MPILRILVSWGLYFGGLFSGSKRVKASAELRSNQLGEIKLRALCQLSRWPSMPSQRPAGSLAWVRGYEGLIWGFPNEDFGISGLGLRVQCMRHISRIRGTLRGGCPYIVRINVCWALYIYIYIYVLRSLFYGKDQVSMSIELVKSLSCSRAIDLTAYIEWHEQLFLHNNERPIYVYIYICICIYIYIGVYWLCE